MTAKRNIRIGITEAGIRHDMLRPPDLATQFRMVRECGAFDYLDKTPPRAQLGEYVRLSERFDLPVLAGGWWYTLGRDDAVLGGLETQLAPARRLARVRRPWIRRVGISPQRGAARPATK